MSWLPRTPALAAATHCSDPRTHTHIRHNARSVSRLSSDRDGHGTYSGGAATLAMARSEVASNRRPSSCSSAEAALSSGSWSVTTWATTAVAAAAAVVAAVAQCLSIDGTIRHTRMSAPERIDHGVPQQVGHKQRHRRHHRRNAQAWDHPCEQPAQCVTLTQHLSPQERRSRTLSEG